ncbi:MAG: hypothetical protein OSJ71_06415 [Acetatifactor sp.]|nr:hypothetical protein [Acetatifactor sp.]
MTDLDLQDAVIREIQALADHQSLKKLNGEVWKNLAIYRQDKPYKDDSNDDIQEDYILVMLGDEDMEEKGDGQWVVTLHILICIGDEDPENQGNMALASLMNQLDLHFRKLGYVDQKYEMQKEAHKWFDHEIYPDFTQCDYVTKWKLPPVHIEGIDHLI